MNNVSSLNDTADSGELALPLTEIGHLFNAPRIDPLSHSPAEVLGVSGVDYLLTLLHMNKKRQRARTLSLLLPPEKASAALAEQTTRALHRLAEWRIVQQRQELRNTYRYGWKVFGVAMVILMICLAFSSLFTSDLTEWMRPLTRTTFEYGFEIIGWVMLWHPIEVLGFTPLAIRSRIAALQTLAAVDVVIQPDQSERLK